MQFAYIGPGEQGVQMVNFGLADMSSHIEVSDNTRFEIASVNKAFTGLLFLNMVERGLLNPEISIKKYLPEFRTDRHELITARQLADFLGGIRHYGSKERTLEFYRQHFTDVRATLPLFADDELVSKPGEKFNYSSYGYNLLAAVIQSAYREQYKQPLRFQDIIQQEILNRLALRDTGFIDVTKNDPLLTKTYTFIDPITRSALDEVVPIPMLDHSYNMGAGNMYSSAKDLVAFGEKFIEPGFVSDAALKEIYTPGIDGSGDPTPLSDGWFVQGLASSPRTLLMGGSYPGSMAVLLILPDEKIILAVTANTWGPNGGGVLEGFSRKLAANIAREGKKLT